MAGAILLREGRGVSMSGLAFDHILDAIRPIVESHNAALARRVWEPVDEGCMDFISFEDLNSDEFGVFYESVRDAYARELDVNPDAPFKPIWKELIEMLSADARAHSIT
ncbi:hypothetical protein GCM10011487_22190 [Steroidobacter agaridevorans]|uniref:Uncharacterized protein n=1 Tax=Steroidobacter agaridevorans TaxID=2695856 RepID=A0A829YA81_9GAMM|nr:hypothetical protein [Steroidobacter agaridevorans]GFE80219.1 hypothetical protein GCM10011487_22190 [Steroidobacter agaridevorans]GFE89811.1 hypothetical protein GCM10011488_47650 [Steroidobacter agaridevorans]